MVLPPIVRAPKSQPRSFAVTIRGNRTPVVVSFLSAERALLASLKEVSVTRRRDVIMDIVVWLRSLGLEKYEAAFRENDIDETVLPSLTAEDLKNLGVSVVGHRLKLLDAIAALRTNAISKTDVATTTGTQSAPEDRAERRQVTVMFSDLVGFTALSARMDDGAACAHRGIIVDGCKRQYQQRAGAGFRRSDRRARHWWFGLDHGPSRRAHDAIDKSHHADVSAKDFETSVFV